MYYTSPVYTDPQTQKAWTLISLEVAWEMYLVGADSPHKHNNALFQLAREHVLYCLPEDLRGDEISVLANHYVHEFLRRLWDHDYSRRPLQVVGIQVEPSWLGPLLASCSQERVQIFHACYEFSMPTAQVMQRSRLPAHRIESVKEDFRRQLRDLMQRDQISLPPTTKSDIDQILMRLARMPQPDCPLQHSVFRSPPYHRDQCSVCRRAQLLESVGLMGPHDTEPPPGGLLPDSQLELLALRLHPKAFGHRKTLMGFFRRASRPIRKDVLLISPQHVQDPFQVLENMLILGRPPSKQVAGIFRHGSGRWTPEVILGPLPHQLVKDVLKVPWGNIENMGPLPETMVTPSTFRWWLPALLAILALYWLSVTETNHAPYPLSGTHESTTDGRLTVRIDVHDDAWLTLVGEGRGQLHLLHQGASPSEKGTLATGYGDYGVSAPADSILAISSATPLTQLPQLISQRSFSTADSLIEYLEREYPSADFLVLGKAP